MKILIIDDDFAFADFAEHLVLTLRHEPLVALEPEQGLALAVSEKPDAILLDVGMPRIGGLEVVRRLKADPATKEIPIILCSMTHNRSEIVDAFGRGVLDFLPKPIRLEDLRNRLAGVLKH